MMSVDPSIAPSLKRTRNESSPLTSLNDGPVRKQIRTDSSFNDNMYRAFVQNAIADLEKGNKEAILSLETQLSGNRLDDEQLSALIRALTLDVAKLDAYPDCVSLIRAILSVGNASKARSNGFIAAYTRFLSILISSSPRWWTTVAESVIAAFTNKNSKANHQVLRYIVNLIPTSTAKLGSLVIKGFPHIDEPAPLIKRYCSNILQLLEYCPEQQKTVWNLILEKLVLIDLGLNEALDDLDEDDLVDVLEEDDLDEQDFDQTENVERKRVRFADDVDFESDNKGAQDNEAADESSDDSDDDDDDDENVPETAEAALKRILATRDKLDDLMIIAFDFIDAKFNESYMASHSHECVVLFNEMLEGFNRYILPTHKPRNVQFLIFSICHKHPELLEQFLRTLLETALSNSTDLTRRQKAMQYIASITARARGMPDQQIREVVAILAAWIQRYVDERESEVLDDKGHMTTKMSKFTMFYSTCQALFYIFCYRHKVLKDAESDSWATSIKGLRLDDLFQRLVVTKFNPLKYCGRNVVAMFAKLAQQENVAFCYGIMEQNRLGIQKSPSPERQAGVDEATVEIENTDSANLELWTAGREKVRLDSYFPFDPYMLPKSRSYFISNYIDWTEVAGSDTDSDSDNADSSEDDFDSDSESESE